MNKHDFKNIDLTKPPILAATIFGVGLMKPAPGTWGSLVAVPLALILFKAGGVIGLSLAVICITALGFWAAQRFQEITGYHDHKSVVIDEVAGQWLVLVPTLYFWGVSALPVLLAFLLFRFFDITKIWPVSYCDQKLAGATGVMMDDIMAGIYASLCMMGLYYAGLI